MSSPFQQSFSAKSPLNQAKQYVGAYENVNTEATHGSNESIVAAIEGIGKVTGGIIEQERAKEEQKDVLATAGGDKNKINYKDYGKGLFDKETKGAKETKETNDRVGKAIEADSLNYGKIELGAQKLPEIRLSNREKKAKNPLQF